MIMAGHEILKFVCYPISKQPDASGKYQINWVAERHMPPTYQWRREDYNRFMQIVGETRAGAIDERLHAERLGPNRTVPIGELPDGAFVLRDGEPWLVLGDELLRWTPAGYADRIARPRNGEAPVVTPPSLLDVLRAGCTGAVPLLHETARSR